MINPRIDRRTGVIIQGITGRGGRLHSQLMRQYGTNVVAGTSPHPDVREVDGIPVFSSCSDAVRATGATASVTFVGKSALLHAMLEAIDAGISYIVTPEEGMPVHDAAKALRLAREKNVVWIGASTPGMAIPGELKLGFLPNAALIPGPLGLMSKSGTLSYEAGYRLAQKNIGQSAWIGVGGDPVKGTRFADLVPFFQQDTQTEGLLILGEIGGNEEEELAAALTAADFNKPVYALIAGFSAPEGVVMGHAGALVHGSTGTFESKRAALTAANAKVFRSIRDMIEAVQARFA